MNLQQIRSIARDRGMKTGNLSKAELIRAIQREEGNFDCFGHTDANNCDQEGCLWRTDCLPVPKKGKAA